MSIVELYRRTWELADATIAELPLDAVGRLPWWGASPVTLHRVLVHVTAETQRHAGHADIIRELIDGSAGLLEGHDNLRSATLPQGRRCTIGSKRQPGSPAVIDIRARESTDPGARKIAQPCTLAWGNEAGTGCILDRRLVNLASDQPVGSRPHRGSSRCAPQSGGRTADHPR